ncbi:MAG: S8/S53 family peptidase [Candidatus Zixiibacteriota bacterium]
MSHSEKNAPSLAGLTLTAMFLVLQLTLSCSKSTDPDTNKPPDNGPIGILLSGADIDSALSGTSDHGPFAVPEEEWEGEFVTTRLEAVINPSATVGAVNAALNAVGAKISCMRAGLMFTELVVPALTSVDEAEVLCSTLVSSEAFLSAYPCFDPTSVQDASIQPGLPANLIIDHLAAAKFPAAWNVRERVAALHSPATVLVADHFRSLTPHAEIPAQTFPTQNGSPSLFIDAFGVAKGNHGFQVAGAIGARFDAVGSTGAYADPGGLLRLPCISLSGFGSLPAVIAELSDRLPSSGQFILNTSISYAGGFQMFPKRQRIEHAFFWRFLTATKQSQFLHLQAAGNEGLSSPSFPNADYASPFTLSARFDAPLEMLQGTAVSTKDTTDLTTLYSLGIANNPLFGSRTNNLLVVGSSSLSGSPSGFSNAPSDVRMVGEWVTLPCIYDDSKCEPGAQVPLQAIVSGTSFATPQVAGLAAWLWSLSPSLTVDETIATIKNCFNGNWVDAYKAVLSLDHSIANAGIRLSLLDIVDANGQMGSDMKFDEKDLQMFLDSIMYYEADRASVSPPWEKDHSPFDLNGDGYTGDTMLTPSTAPFDLDINTPPAYSTVDVIPCDQPSTGDKTLNESAVTDRDILLYYAYSPLYSGDLQIRDSLFGKGCSPFTIVETTHFLKYDLRAYLDAQYWDIDSSQGTFLHKTLAVREPACLATYVFDVEATCNTSLSSGVSLTSVDITGTSNSTVTGTASLENDLGTSCDYRATAKAFCYSVVHFTASEQLGFVPFRFVVDGSIDIGDGNTAQTYTYIMFHTVDANGKPDGPTYAGFDSQTQSFPYVLDGTLDPLLPGRMYQLMIMTTAADAVFALSDPGPDSKSANAIVSLHVGP